MNKNHPPHQRRPNQKPPQPEKPASAEPDPADFVHPVHSEPLELDYLKYFYLFCAAQTNFKCQVSHNRE